MKKILTILLLVFNTMPVILAQSPYWMRSAGGFGVDEGLKISIDGNNNTYTTGYFSGVCTFDTGLSLTASGATDIFITKVNDQGILQWAVKAGGMGPDRGLSIKADQQGNCYVTGIYFGSATFGNTTINSVGGSQDVFIAKYNSAGILQWVVSAGGPEGESGNGITVDNSGNVIVTGQFSGTAHFGSISLSSMIDPSTLLPSIDVFTTKLDASGNFLWAKKGSAIHTDRGLDVASDPAGNIYVTGQFSDTITFDNTYNNQMYNTIFLIKYNSNGTEQWFRKIGGSVMNIAYSIAVDANSNIYLTGDFLGTLIFFGSPDVHLTNAYPNNIFIAKYNNAGSLLWSQADGSNSDISSRCIALDDSSDAYIVGNFRCTLSEYADFIGQGTFNSVGFKDIFVTKYNQNGQRQWMRQGGGQQEDFGAGITVKTFKKVIITGSFNEKIFFPSNNNFTNPNSIYFTSQLYPAYLGTYCNDASYGQYCCIPSYGNTDILIAKAIDITRQPYDYYTRTSGNNLRPYVGACINTVNGSDNYCSGDSAGACATLHLNGATNTSQFQPGSNSPGPYFTWHWSGGGTNQLINVNTSGNYAVTITSLDGCYSSSDTIYVAIHPLPPKPLISDNYIVNTNAFFPQTIHLCYPDNVTLTGSTSASHYYWYGGNTIDSSLSITVNESGLYNFIVIDSFGCQNYNAVQVILDFPLDSLPLGMMLCYDSDHNDSIEICMGNSFTILIYDTVTNHSGNLICIVPASTSWFLSPALPFIEHFETWITCMPTQSGIYQINAQMIRLNNCDTDTIVFNKTIYVKVNPTPVVNISLSGDTSICSGDTTVLSANGASSYLWSGPGIIGNPNQPDISVNMPGNYQVFSNYIDANGCSDSVISTINVNLKPSPLITMIPFGGVICPNDSAFLQCSGIGNFQWYNSAGIFGLNSSFVSVSSPGYYYCVLTDTSGCILSSNSVELLNYATPYLEATPSAFLCTGSNCTISAISGPGSIIQWQPPLSGNNSSQTISTAGTYHCLISLCNIITDASIVITMANTIAQITPAGPLNLCVMDSVILTANPGMAGYQWSIPGSFNQTISISQPGTFTLTTTDAVGCTATDFITINQYPELPAPVLSDTSICAGNSITLHVIASASVEWFSDASGGTPFNIGSSFTTPLLTSDTIFYVQVTDTICHSLRVPYNINVIIIPLAPEIINNSPLCEGDTLTLKTSPVSGANYQWAGTNSFYSVLQNVEIQDININNSGTYTLKCTVDGCQSGITSANIVINAKPFLDIGNDTTICIGIPFIINTGNFSSYLWQDGSSNSSYLVDTKGDYSVIVTDNKGCKSKDSISIDFIDCTELIIPNVFTPNGDGINDYFSVYAPGSTGFICRIYNRWGSLIATLNGSQNSWDGIVQQSGGEASDGVYYYIIGYIDFKGEAKTDHGFFHLFR